MRKGFTLIELLLVIGIIGILLSVVLGSLINVRRGARDDQRIADLSQVAQALQLFYLKCGFYPGHYDPASSDPKTRCLGGLNDASAGDDNPGDWPELQRFLGEAEIGFSTIPNDPVPGQNYHYWVQLGDSSASPPVPRAQCYVLGADFETSHRALDNDLDDGDLAGMDNLSASCDDDDVPPRYCRGNNECFAR